MAAPTPARDSSGHPVSQRIYSDAEITAARQLKLADREVGRGVIYFATGDYWPGELERRARKFERDAARARLVAAALRREQQK